ncbi:hypothetical protein ABW19_dt0206654 [Dactylella cylindrospora]|nr:hypothetical protein ABW19_dt0206654 [Dactylella cylindrospora]
MRWLEYFALSAGIAKFALAEVPESLSDGFLDGYTLTATFSSGLTVRDGDTASVDPSTGNPSFSLTSSGSTLEDNTLFTVIQLDITGRADPLSSSTFAFAESNLRSPAVNGGDLGSGVIQFSSFPAPQEQTSTDWVYLVFPQDGELTDLEGVPEINDREEFSVSEFQESNGFAPAVAGLGFTAVRDSSDGTPTTQNSFTGFPNTTTTASSLSTTSIPSNTTTTASSPEPTEPPFEPSTSYLTLSVSGSTRTVIYTRPNDPGSTLTPPTSTSVDPSLITNDPNAGSQNVASRASIALLGITIFLVAFV